MADVDAQQQVMPEGAREDVCRSCSRPVWWVQTAGGRPMPLDLHPLADGNIEMVRVGSTWLAEQLPQTEALFDLERPRWCSHFATCPDARAWRQRSGRSRAER
jgi:hypothetical protein